jgi:diguanylate cyclase (GGDEF)-like protein/PAS domain S-box-containing protein
MLSDFPSTLAVIFYPSTLVEGGFWPDGVEAWSGWLVLGLVGLLAYQQWRLYRFRQEAARREELFRIVAENAADMIALVDMKGRRLYNSPAYQKVLGYSAAELAKTSSFEQIHQEDRYRVLEAAREARRTGVGKKLEYRIQHKDGGWRVLESIASTIKNAHGEVEKLVIVNRDITERKRAEEQLEHNSFHDALTGLPNRRLFLDRLQRCRGRAHRNPDYQYAVLLADIDDFNIFNDSQGQAAGDRLIVEIGRRMEACLRENDTVARPNGKPLIPDALLSRLGGDEFTILLEEITDPSDALRVATRIQRALAAPWAAEKREMLGAASIGIALSASLHDRAEDLLQDADTAMRRAKALGGSRCEVFDEGLHTRATNRLRLETEMRTALDQHQFQLYYQPVVHLASKRITGFEALLRWRHPERGVISADKFIDVAEDAGLIVAVGKWVMSEACRQMKVWQSRYSAAGALNITVNLSARQLAYPQLLEDMKATLREHQLDAARLQVEMKESVLLADVELTYEFLTQLKYLGISSSVSDFAAGYSSLRWLRRWPLDELKIERSLANGILTDRHGGDIVKLIVSLARELKLRVVAEGVESTPQSNRLQALGCEFAQGYLFSGAVEAEQAESLLQAGRSAKRNPASTSAS